MSLITVDLRSRKQLYEQIIDCVKELILEGELKADEKLPSVRALATELSINPNTIQKAYSELERQGIIVTLPGRGSVVTQQTDLLVMKQKEKLESDLYRIAVSSRQIGLDESDFKTMCDEAWSESNRESLSGISAEKEETDD